MFTKKEFAVVSNLRFLAAQISCSVELSMKEFYNIGPVLLLTIPRLMYVTGALRLMVLFSKFVPSVF